MLDIVGQDCATPEPCLVVSCISGQCLAAKNAEGQVFSFSHKLFGNEIRIFGLIRQLLPTWSIYSESHQYFSFFYQLFHIHTKCLKMKFAFSGLIMQLLQTWPIYSERYEYTPFSIKS
jgi:hypothetical protein